MRISLYQGDSGDWQADVYLPDGRDFHAVGRKPGDALISLGMFWLAQPEPKDSDMQTLAQILKGETP